MDNTLKRHLTSAAITFLTVFVVSVAAQLTSGALTPDNLGSGVVVSVLLTAVRAAFKGVSEFFGLSGDN